MSPSSLRLGLLTLDLPLQVVASLTFAFLLNSTLSHAETKPERARDLGISFNGVPGKCNAITDVDGVRVGHKTIVRNPEKGPIRTGVTVISPSDPHDAAGVRAGFFSFNGTGEMTGVQFINEYGAFFGPLALTGTNSVGVVRDALHIWAQQFVPSVAFSRSLPVVGETYDGALNTGVVTKQQVFSAIQQLASGPVAEGSVGGGTGMISFDFKSGIGTASRLVPVQDQQYTVGVLVQSNFGSRRHLMVTGVPVGEQMLGVLPPVKTDQLQNVQDGSIVVIIATNAPLESRQLQRIARRGVLGLARTGSMGENLSGDLFLAFSTENKIDLRGNLLQNTTLLADAALEPLFEATVQATEEAIINALVAGQKMTGIRGTVFGIPHDQLRTLIMKAQAWKTTPDQP